MSRRAAGIVAVVAAIATLGVFAANWADLRGGGANGDAARSSTLPTGPSSTIRQAANGDTNATELDPTMSTTTTTEPPVTRATGRSGDLLVDSSVSAGNLSPSGFAVFSTHVRDIDGDDLRVDWEFGDGRGTPARTEAAGCPEPGVEPDPHPIDVVDRQDHAYRYPGRYRAVATVVSKARRCARAAEPATEQVSVVLEVIVNPGAVHSNGPRPAQLKVSQDQSFDDAVRVFAFAYEEDGYLATLRVDWGDGTAADTLSRNLDECRSPPMAWPASGWAGGRDPSHRYTQPGAYVVTVTFSSYGCDGKEEQTSSQTATVHSPGPQYEATATAERLRRTPSPGTWRPSPPCRRTPLLSCADSAH